MSDQVQDVSSDDENTSRLVYKHKYGSVELYPESLNCLDEGQYLKDDIVQFYIAYLLDQVCSPAIAERVHIFDNIFNKQLEKIFQDDKMDLNKFWSLQKWYNGSDLFEKHYLIFPICSSDHWTAIIVCYPGCVSPFDELIECTNGRQQLDHIPGIMILDSLMVKHPKATLRIRDFLDYEWRFRDQPVKRFGHLDLADYCPKLPKQKNQFDCGIYMLMYLKTFLEQPDHFYDLVRHKEEDSLRLKIRSNLQNHDRITIRSVVTRFCLPS